MKQVLRRVLSLAILIGTTALADGGCCPTTNCNTDDCCPTQVCDFKGDCGVTTCYPIRSQGRNKVMQMVGSVGHTHLYDMECWYGTFALTGQYQQSFRAKKIAQCLFGTDLLDCECDRTIQIRGSDFQSNRDPRAWLADYFYLPRDYCGSFTIDPKIQNFNLWFDLYVGLDEWCSGMYFRLYGPATWTKWDLNFCECCDVTGTQSHKPGYFNATGIENCQLLRCFSQYACGASICVPDDPTIYQGLRYSRIRPCDETKGGFADLRWELGWSFLQCDCYSLGLNIQGAFPTGNKCRACYIFDPIIGNKNRWELGGGLIGHYMFWTSEDEEGHFGFYLDANLTHMFKSEQQRTFDLCHRPNSKYALVQKFGKNDQALRGDVDGPLACRQFAQEFAPLANISTLDVDVSVGVQADIVAMFNYTCRCFSWDFGYNFWGRSCESIKCPDNCPCPADCPNLCSTGQENTWALKGDARVYGFAADNSGSTSPVLDQFEPVRLSATETRADIHNGTNRVPVNCGPDDYNKCIDCPRTAYAGGDPVVLYNTPFESTGREINTSIQPKFLQCCDLDLLETRGLSHKVFTHFQWNWDCECWDPYLGVGASAEFGRNEDCCDPCDDKCTNCIDCSLSQWSVWVKGGVSFN